MKSNEMSFDTLYAETKQILNVLLIPAFNRRTFSTQRVRTILTLLHINITCSCL